MEEVIQPGCNRLVAVCEAWVRMANRSGCAGKPGRPGTQTQEKAKNFSTWRANCSCNA